MTAGPSRLPALRVRLPCEDEKDFYARFADAIAEKGLRVPTANLRPIGTRVRIALEFRDASTVSGEAIVDAHVEGARPTMNVRFVRFEKRHDAGPAPAPAGTAAPSAAGAAATAAAAGPERTAEAPPAGPQAPPKPSPEASFESLFEEEAAEAAGASPVKASPPEDSFESLNEGEEDAPAGASPAEPRPAGAQRTEELELLRGAEPAPAAGPAPTPVPRPAVAAPRVGGLPPASRRTVLAAVAVAAVAVLGSLGYALTRRTPPPSPPAPAAPAAPAADAALEAHVVAADGRLSDGRLGGADGALEHLLAAQALRPQDPRIAERLSLLADTLERLGARALERGDLAEAEVHLGAARQAAPDRESIRGKLEALARTPRKREAGSSRGTEAPPPTR